MYVGTTLVYAGTCLLVPHPGARDGMPAMVVCMDAICMHVCKQASMPHHASARSRLPPVSRPPIACAVRPPHAAIPPCKVAAAVGPPRLDATPQLLRVSCMLLGAAIDAHDAAVAARDVLWRSAEALPLAETIDAAACPKSLRPLIAPFILFDAPSITFCNR